jgi:hypothetical protein
MDISQMSGRELAYIEGESGVGLEHLVVSRCFGMPGNWECTTGNEELEA